MDYFSAEVLKSAESCGRAPLGAFSATNSQGVERITM